MGFFVTVWYVVEFICYLCIIYNTLSSPPVWKVISARLGIVNPKGDESDTDAKVTKKKKPSETMGVIQEGLNMISEVVERFNKSSRGSDKSKGSNGSSHDDDSNRIDNNNNDESAVLPTQTEKLDKID
jgi:hypothetical protein